ncbi:MAG: hypothetical protein AB1649_31670 [Chloroflexota bacterium]
MNELETILEECLDQMMNGASTLDECLVRHPEHAAQLLPLLLAARRAQHGRAVTPSPAFKARTRTAVMQQARSHPRPNQRKILLRAALSVAFILAAFLAVSALAQAALPGDALYHWKLTSETAWRSIAPDTLGVDLALADRRVEEIVAVTGDEVRVIEALEEYKVLLARFQSDAVTAHQERIAPVLASHRTTLAQAGLLIPELDNYVVIDDQVEDSSNPVTPEPPSH